MYGKLIKNDIRKNRLITVTITAFILVAAMLTSLAASLIVNLFGAIDNMLVKSRTPHFLHMHMGDIDMERLRCFADNQSGVEAFQALEFLNIDGAEIIVGGDSLAWSVQDNGFSKQSKEFDFLLDLNGGIIHPADGEIYVPLYYMTQGAAKVGDAVTIRSVTFNVAGFLRDSQMNAALASSKRFLVGDNDFEKIRPFGIMEYLIEFRLTEFTSTSVFETEYLKAELPANGPPAITYSVVRLINAITDGLMIAVMVKYGAMAGTACTAGFLVSLLIQGPFMENIRLYLGESNRALEGLLSGLLGAAFIFLAVMLYVNSVLHLFAKYPRRRQYGLARRRKSRNQLEALR